MKKWASLAVAFIIGVVVASSSGTVLAKVQSLVGQKVTGELKVIVNGKELADKGAVVNGRTNAPVRAIAEAIGGEVELSGDTVNITTKATPSTQTNGSKETFNEEKLKLERSIESLQKDKNEMEAKYEAEPNPGYQGAIDSLDRLITTKQAELDKINEALKSNE